MKKKIFYKNVVNAGEEAVARVRDNFQKLCEEFHNNDHFYGDEIFSKYGTSSHQTNSV